jgi:hypothetical protein
MHRITILAVGAVCALMLLAGPAGAGSYGLSGFGGKLGYVNPEGLDGTLHAGAHLEFEAAGTRLHILPNVMFWRANDVRDVNPNVDLYYHFNAEGMVTPYVGAGLGVNFIDDERFNTSDSHIGANLMGGMRFPGASSHYFVEGRYTASDISQFSVLGGMTFHR